MCSCENWIIRSRTSCKGFLRQGHKRKRSSLGDASLCTDCIWPEAHRAGSREQRSLKKHLGTWDLL